MVLGLMLVPPSRAVLRDGGTSPIRSFGARQTSQLDSVPRKGMSS